jgi:hypothetical protein
MDPACAERLVEKTGLLDADRFLQEISSCLVMERTVTRIFERLLDGGAMVEGART